MNSFQNLAFRPRDFDAAHEQFRRAEHCFSPNLNVLDNFQGHSLETQNTAALMDRIDNKYLINATLFTELLSRLSTDYSILEISGDRSFTYENIYFDSSQRDYYFQHHNGKLNRQKVRYRRYRETNTCFLEIKLKNNKQRTVKSRIQVDHNQAFSFAEQQFAECNGISQFHTLVPTLLVNYQRITLLNRDKTERLTIDFNLHFHNLDGQCSKALDRVFVAELKREAKTGQSLFFKLMRDYRIKSTGFSKYCMGVCLTDKERQLKHNRFKPQLNHLQKVAMNQGPLKIGISSQ